MSSPRRDRQLSWITVDGQRYPSEKAADALDAVDRGLCPFCGEGPFTVPAIHVSKKHGVDRITFRDWLGVARRASICDPTHSAACSNHASELASVLWGDNGPLQANQKRRVERATGRTAEMVRLFEGGMTMRAIADQFGCSFNTVRNWMHRLGYVEDARTVGSPAAEARRGARLGPQPDRWSTHCKRGHEFTAENTYVDPGRGRRHCRECMRENDRRRPSGSRRQRMAAEARKAER